MPIPPCTAWPRRMCRPIRRPGQPPQPSPVRAGQAADAAPTPAAAATAPAPAPAPAPAAAASAPAPQARLVGVDRERPLPSIERALSGPGSRGDVSWRRQVKVVPGGQGPGKRDQEALDRDRARLPLPGPRRIVVLGCTRGAGQTLTALMTGPILAVVPAPPVSA